MTELRERANTARGDEGGGIIHTHKIVRGLCDLSSIANYGIHLAQSVSFPDEVIEKANELVEEINAKETALPEVRVIAFLDYFEIYRVAQNK